LSHRFIRDLAAALTITAHALSTAEPDGETPTEWDFGPPMHSSRRELLPPAGSMPTVARLLDLDLRALGELRLPGGDEDGPQGVGAKGLRHDGQAPRAGALHHGGLTQARHEDDRQARSAASDRLHYAPAAAAGHDDIDEDQVPAPLGEARQTARGI